MWPRKRSRRRRLEAASSRREGGDLDERFTLYIFTLGMVGVSANNSFTAFPLRLLARPQSAAHPLTYWPRTDLQFEFNRSSLRETSRLDGAN